MQHLLSISELSHDELLNLIDRARVFKTSKTYPAYSHEALANLFYENSTRTRISFELAAHRLSIPVINLDINRSSESKGEAISDTIHNLAAMGINLFVMRHSENGLQARLAAELGFGAHMINAGDGTHAHPSQALLDIMTISERFSDFSSLKVAIVGNIRHSRVANSLQIAFKTLNLGRLSLVAPKQWQPTTVHYGLCTESLSEGLKDADVVIALRVQKERLEADSVMNLDEYRLHYAITQQSLALAKPNAMLMHPGPVNRGLEMDSDCVDGSQSAILTQVTNGVFMRMAILEACVT